MKRAELEARLAGVDNAKEIIDFIMAENGKDVNAAKTGLEAVTAERDSLKTDLEKFKDFTPEKIEQFKAYDPKEHQELKEYKEKKEAEAVTTKKTEALDKLLTANNVTNEKARKLLIKATNLEKIELTDTGEIKDGANIITPLKTEYGDFFTVKKQGGADPIGQPPGAGGGDPGGELSLRDAMIEHYKK